MGFIRGLWHACRCAALVALGFIYLIMPLTLHSQAISNRRPEESGVKDLQAIFRSPPAAYGPVPFFWWAGETLERGRLAWQLDQLRDKGIRQTIISYPHHPDGSSDLGDPPLFSAEWWELFRWFLTACRERGMTVGFQDYTLVAPILKAIGQETPDMQGGQMSCVANRAADNGCVRLTAEPNTRVIGAWAYPIVDGLPQTEGLLLLTDRVCDGELSWLAPSGGWWVTLVFARINAFDPLHPDSGRLAIDKLYAPFERECPGEVGKTLNLFFQDELDFGCRMPFWSTFLLDSFAQLKGYDLAPLLPALWHDFGNLTEKIRLDYADVVSRRLESCYFEPVFRWHESRGTLFGHDNCGRGRIAEGRAHYGDYFRAMRWYSAPGCDDPRLHGARAFKGLKVNSSIAHLYQRPRVWVEAFHSSGWGTTPAEVVAAIHEDFACGATVVNLHGLYYSTFGGWWEWAPPDFHFRQPYWQHAKSLNDYFTRLSWLLSRGVHRCDVAIVYPITALDAEPANPACGGLVAHVANDDLDGAEADHPQPEASAFQLGKYLFDRNCDFDFLDFESLERTSSADGGLHVAGGTYRVLILPAMAVLRFSTLEKARDFVLAGGVVIAYGCLPRASDRAGRCDPLLTSLIVEVFGDSVDDASLEKNHPGGGRAFFFPMGWAKVLEAIRRSIHCDVVSSVPLQVLHRQLADEAAEVFYLFNPALHPVVAEVTFRAAGRAELWNAWTGEIQPAATDSPLAFGAREAKLLVLRRQDRPAMHPALPPCHEASVLATLDGPWEFQVVPTLDNRFGDFSQPPMLNMLGPQARRFRYADAFDAADDWHAPGFDDSAWLETTYSFGPRLESIGPIPPGGDLTAIEDWLVRGGPEPADHPAWQPYPISLRWGIEHDPFLTDWLGGPHGLKGRVPEEFLDFYCEVPGSAWYVRAVIAAEKERVVPMHIGARCAYQAWLNGNDLFYQNNALPPGRYEPWSIPHYECEPREHDVALHSGENRLVIKLVQPAGQRTRAFFRFTAEQAPSPLMLRGFHNLSLPRPALPAPAGRRGIRFRFTGPPGMRTVRFLARGPACLWIDGATQSLDLVEITPDGSHRYNAYLTTRAVAPCVLALVVAAPADSRAGDALPEPVCFECGCGTIPLGDWCQQGLATYSGAATYSRSFEVADCNSQLDLALGQLSATAEVRVNGHVAATLIAPPWKCEITPFLKPGKNQLSITIANTLANHYSVGIPTPYAFDSQTRSGLFGPVALITTP